jgi:SAM-dependent methyltransferase
VFDAMMARIQQLSVSVESLAALGAELRLRQDRLDADPRLHPLLREALRAVDPRWLEHTDARESATALALIQTVFRQSLDLLENPARPPGWSCEDPQILQTQGQLSRIVVRGIAALASERPELAAALHEPGVLLDVGTGVGWLAVEAARTWPALRVVGLDPWEPSLVLARHNLAHSEVADRIEFRAQRIEQLEETATVSLAWLPGPFIAREAVDQALVSVQRALVPGGWLIFGLAAAARDPLEEALVRLRITRSGGYPWTPEEVQEHLRRRDFTEIEAFLPRIPLRFVIARRAGVSRPGTYEPRQRPPR